MGRLFGWGEEIVMCANKVKYKGDLNKKIVVKSPPIKPSGIFDREECWEEYREKRNDYFNYFLKIYFKETCSKLQLLMDHYSIEKNNGSEWFLLSLQLAFDHVEGFKFEAESNLGRPEKWSPILLAKLYFDVNRKLNDKQSTSKAWACDQLVKITPWMDLNISSKSLQNKLKQAESSEFVKIYNKVKSELQMDNLSEQFIHMIDQLYFDKVSH